MAGPDLPKFLFFDLGKVLVEFDHDLAVQNLADLTQCEPGEIKGFVFLSGLQKEYETGKISTPQFCQRFRDRFQSDASDAKICRAASDIFRVNATIIPLITSLRLAGYPLGILSNTCHAHWNWICNHPFQIIYRFQPWVLSFEVGASKPDSSIYQAAARQVGFETRQLFFVDDLPENVAGACKAGVDAVLFTDTDTLAVDLRNRGLSFNY